MAEKIGAEVLLVVKKLSRRINHEVMKLRRMEDLIKRTSHELDGLPHAQNHASTVEKLTCAIVDAKELVQILIGLRSACRVELVDLLEKLLGKFSAECQTLIYRYAYEYFFTSIETVLNYSKSSVYRFHREGLKMLGISVETIRTLEEDF